MISDVSPLHWDCRSTLISSTPFWALKPLSRDLTPHMGHGPTDESFIFTFAFITLTSISSFSHKWSPSPHLTPPSESFNSRYSTTTRRTSWVFFVTAYRMKIVVFRKYNLTSRKSITKLIIFYYNSKCVFLLNQCKKWRYMK